MRRAFQRFLATSVAFALACPAYASSAAFPGKALIVNGQRYFVIQEDDIRGRLVKQVITGPELQEISLDTDGDGTVDEWEVTKGSVTIHASVPYRGDFSRLSLSQRLKNGVVEAELQLTKDRKSYTVASARVRPYRVDRREDVVIGSCLLYDPALDSVQKEFREMLSDIKKSTEEGVKSNITDILRLDNNAIIDSSCRSGKFKNSFESLTGAMAKVITSGAQDESPDPTYLRCLEKHELGVHAARIEKRFLQLIRGGVQDYVPYTCEYQAASFDKKGVRGFTPYAAYREAKNQIVFHRTKEELDKWGPPQADDMYAKNFFHEMLHLSGIESEQMVMAAEGCCGGFSGDANEAGLKKNACDQLDKRVKDVKFYQVMTSVLVDQLPGFAALQSEVFYNFGEGNGNQLLATFFAELKGVGAAASEEYKSCQSEGAKKGTNHCDGQCISDCAAKYTSSIESMIRARFPQLCENAKPFAEKQEDIDCGALAERIIKMIREKDAGCVPAGANGATKASNEEWRTRRQPTFVDLLLWRSRAYADEAVSQCTVTGTNGDASQIIGRENTSPATLSDLETATRYDALGNAIRTGMSSSAPVDKDKAFEVRSAVPQAQADKRSEEVTYRPVDKEHLTPSPMPIQSVPLGEPDRARHDIAARADRSTQLVDGAERILTQIKDRIGGSILPTANAAVVAPETQKGPVSVVHSNLSETGNSIARPSSSSGNRHVASSGLSSKTFSDVQVPNSHSDFALKPLAQTQNGLADVDVSGSNRSAQLAQRAGASSSPDRSAEKTETRAEADAARARAFSALSTAGKIENGRSTSSDRPSSSRFVVASNPVERKLGSVAADERSVNPLKKAFPDRVTVEKYITGRYAEVLLQLQDANFIKLLIDYKLQVADHDGKVYGSRHVDAKKFKYESKVGKLVLIGGVPE